jgi:DEAD/DEAH box helicase domain-containing protein
MNRSGLGETIERLASRAASAVVARSRLNSPALNAVLLRRLAAQRGKSDTLIADPVFEAARVWQTAPCSLGDLDGNLLHPDLMAALDGAATERMPRDRQPFAHQLQAWQAAQDGLSILVTSGTGSGKTECFMVPVLDDLLRDLAKGQLS